MGSCTIQSKSQISPLGTVDLAAIRYRRFRMAHWNRVAESQDRPQRTGAFYHRLLGHHYRFFIPSGLRVLELGCGTGDLLDRVKPAFGVGVDFSVSMLRRAAVRHPHLAFVCVDVHDVTLGGPFDVIILSDLMNDLWDVQAVLENLRPLLHPGTRLVMNFHNHLWRVPLSLASRLGLGAEVLEQNWLAPQDVANLLTLTGFQIVRHVSGILLPLEVRALSKLANRFLVHIWPFSWFAMTHFVVARPVSPVLEHRQGAAGAPSVSVIVPARNEAGNVTELVERLPRLGSHTELIFVEGHSQDRTAERIERAIGRFPDRTIRFFRQSGRGKGDAVRLGFEKAGGQILMILDADMTVAPEDLGRFYHALVSGAGEFINGVRLVYPLENQAMRFFNMMGNKSFSLAFSWLLDQPIKDTLCGTKVLWKRDYLSIARNRSTFGEFDPFGDFDLLFGAAKLNLKITEVPIRYRSRRYGQTNIHRWRHGLILLKMVLFAAWRIKFI